MAPLVELLGPFGSPAALLMVPWILLALAAERQRSLTASASASPAERDKLARCVLAVKGIAAAAGVLLSSYVVVSATPEEGSQLTALCLLLGGSLAVHGCAILLGLLYRVMPDAGRTGPGGASRGRA